jgi:choline transport protein
LFPLASIYQQATNSAGGTIGLRLCAFLPYLIGMLGSYLTVSRVFWTLARDNATPFAGFFGQVHSKQKNPFNAILFCAVVNTLLGCIYIGSVTAFNAFVGSFVILSCLSYLAAILPHLLSGRSTVMPGWFWMRGAVGFVVNATACAYIVVFTVVFMFPFSRPVSAATMNYSSLMCGSFSLFVAGFWFWRRADFEGAKYVPPTAEAMAVDAM